MEEFKKLHAHESRTRLRVLPPSRRAGLRPGRRNACLLQDHTAACRRGHVF
jgi:hypothetical protein